MRAGRRGRVELNIGGTEWITIVFVALVLVLGTGRLPGAARKLGRAAAQYRRARDEVGSQMGAGRSLGVSGPVSDERQKLESMAASMGLDAEGLDTEQLRRRISSKMGGARSTEP